MKRKLLALNLALLAILAYASWRVREAWLAEQAREAAEHARPLKPSPPPPYTPPPVAPPVVPAGYADIAQQDLFDKSRNPTVVVEAPPPPPPKPMPPLPVYHGQMNIGSGPMAIFSQGPNAVHEALHPGETIGQFKLLDVNTEEIALEWDGKVIRKKVDELLDRTAAPPPGPVAALRTEQPAPAPAPVVKREIGPGAETGRGTRVCDPADSMPTGSIKDGYRKVVAQTPFGESCVWEPVGR